MPCQFDARLVVLATIFVVVLHVLMCAAASVNEVAAQPRDLGREPRYRRVCYYTNWSQYRKEEGRFLPANIDPFLCTHLVFAFAKVDNRGQLAPYEWNDIQYPYLYRQFNDLKKKNPHLKTLLAVGGWTHGSGPFTQMVRDKSDRRIFLDHAVQYLRTHGFDGLDLDWEYPANRGSPPEDKENFSFLIKELHEGFKNEAERTGQPRLLLTAAVAGGEKIIKSAYDVPKVDKYLDFINLMSYDFHGSWSSSLGHNAPLYGGDFNPEESSNTHSVDEAVRVWLELGASREKLVVGIPFYGRSFTTCGSDVKPGMRNCGTGKSGPYTMENGFISFYEMEDKLASGWQRVWLDREKVPFAYHLPTKQWVGYDDVESITIKAQYIKDEGLGGAMVWSLDLDDFAPIWSDEPYPLGRTIRNILDEDVEYPKFKPPPTTGKKRKSPAAKKIKEDKEELIATKGETKKQSPSLKKPESVNSKPNPLDRMEMKEHIQTKLKLLDSDIKNKVHPDSPLMGLSPRKTSAFTSTTSTTSTTRPSTGTSNPSDTTLRKISTVSTRAFSTSRVSKHPAEGWTKRPEDKVASGDMRGETTRHRESSPMTSPASTGSTDRTSPPKRWQENFEQRLWHFVDVPYKASATVKPAKFSGASTTRTTMNTTSLSPTSSSRSLASEKVRHVTSSTSPSTWRNPSRASEQSLSTASSAHSSVSSTHSTVMSKASISFSSSDQTLTTRDFNMKATSPAEAKWWEKIEKNDGDKQKSGDIKVSPSASPGLTTTIGRMSQPTTTHEQRKAKWWNHVTKATTIPSRTLSTASSPQSGSSTLQTSPKNGQSLGVVVKSNSIPTSPTVSYIKTENPDTRPLPLSYKVDQAHPSEPSRTPDSVATQKLPRSDDEATKYKPGLTIRSSVKPPAQVSSLRSANTTTAVPVAATSGAAVRYLFKEISGTDTEVRTSDVKPLRRIISVDVKSRGDTPLDTGNLVHETQESKGGRYVVNGQRTDVGEVKGKLLPANSIFSRMTTTRELKANLDEASSSLTTASTTTSTTVNTTTIAAPTSATTTRWWERTTKVNATSHLSATSTTAAAPTVKSTLLSSTTGISPSGKYHTQTPNEWIKVTPTPAASTALPRRTSVTWSSVSRRHLPLLNFTLEKTKAATVNPDFKFSSRLPVGTSTPSILLSTSPAVSRTSPQGEDRPGSTAHRLRTPRPSSGTLGGMMPDEEEEDVLRSVENVKVEDNGEDWQARRTWWHRTGKPVRVEVRGTLLKSATQRLEDTTKKCDPDAQVEQFKATGSEPESMRAGVEVPYDVSEVKSPSHLPDNETPIEAIFYPDYKEYEFQCPTVFGIYSDPLDCARFYQCVWLVAFHHVCGPGTVWNDDMKICDWPTAFSCRS